MAEMLILSNLLNPGTQVSSSMKVTWPKRMQQGWERGGDKRLAATREAAEILALRMKILSALILHDSIFLWPQAKILLTGNSNRSSLLIT